MSSRARVKSSPAVRMAARFRVPEWHFAGLCDWSTEKIFATLREHGVDTDAERFRAQAEAAGEGATLDQDWFYQMGEPEDYWGDFSWMAIEQLWCRLTPDLLDKDSLNRRFLDLIYDGFTESGDLRESQRATALAFIRDLLTYLERFPSEERATRLRAQSDYAMADLGGLLGALTGEMLMDQPELLDRTLDLLEPYSAYSPEDDLDIAEALALGDREEAARRRIEIALQAPGAGASRFRRAAEVLELVNDLDGALVYLEKALTAAVTPAEWDVAFAHADVLLHRLGRGSESEALERTHRRPLPVAVDAATLRRVAPGVALRPFSGPRKVGRNDPCPCGSGKKYKKCCGSKVG